MAVKNPVAYQHTLPSCVVLGIRLIHSRLGNPEARERKHGLAD
jgi:hypothetical protein